MPEETEVSLKQVLNSIWFKGASRIGILVLLPVAGYFWHEFTDQNERITAIETDRASRIISSEARAKRVDDAIISMTQLQASQADDLDEISTDISNINGQLTVLLKQKRETGEVLRFYEDIIPQAASTTIR